MHRLAFAFLFSSLGAGILAQEPADAGTAPSAAARWKEVGDRQAARMKNVDRSDPAARTAVLEDYARDLQAFLAQFPGSREANAARVAVAQVAAQEPKHAAAGKAAIAAFDPAKADAASTLQAAAVAKHLGAEQDMARLLDAADAQARTIEERIELLGMLKLAVNDAKRFAAALERTEAMATTAAMQSELALGKARLFRHENRRDAAGYEALLAAIVEQFPGTRAARIAAGKLAAAKLAPGSDPVPFTAKDLDGKDVSIADYKGKVLLIDFWATWCGPCMAELPHLLDVWRKHHDAGFEVLGISLDRAADKDKLLATIQEHGMSWRHVFDGKFWSAEIAELYDVQSIPHAILIGRDGKVIATRLRGRQFDDAITAALAAEAKD
jgi:peroxiredoxin